jgi:pimeloyl-ACP methyl ester carboxylesterase
VLHVERSGSGEPFLLLHGAAGSSATYGWLPDVGRTVVRMDFRGHGRSDRADSYLLGDYAEDALSVLREIGPAPVVGHSLGGVVAWTLAQRVPELVTGIVLEDPPLYMGEPAEHARNQAMPYFGVLRGLAERWQADGTPLADAADELRRQEVDARSADDALVARAYALMHLDPGALDPIVDGTALAATDLRAPVSAPALILAAGEDSAFPPGHEQRLASSHPDVVVRRVPGSRHSIHDERAHRAEYLQALSERL